MNPIFKLFVKVNIAMFHHLLRTSYLRRCCPKT